MIGLDLRVAVWEKEFLLGSSQRVRVGGNYLRKSE